MPSSLPILLPLAAAAMLTACTAAGDGHAVGSVSTSTAANAPRAVPAVVRLPMTAALSCSIPDLREDLLTRLNALRAQGAQCGSRRMPPAPPLAWSDVLFSAAARHSLDMAAHNYFDHVDARGRRPDQRVSAEGYRWRAVAENIAGGDGSVSSVMRGWQRSPDHCRAMLDPAYADVGVACVERPDSEWGTYWTMDLGRTQ